MQYELSWRETLCLVAICWQVVIANAVWRSVGDEIASTTPQVWLVAGSHLGFAKKSFHSIASDKNRAVSVELVSRLPRRVFYTARHDKNCKQVACDGIASPRWDSQVTRIAGQRTCGKYKRRVIITSVLGMEARQGSDSLDFFFGLLGNEAERTSAAQGFDC
jgi:hypothetical protein